MGKKISEITNEETSALSDSDVFEGEESGGNSFKYLFSVIKSSLKTYFDAIYEAAGGGSGFPAGHLYGLTLSNNATDPTNDIDITTGKCRSGADNVDMIFASAFTKRLDADWAPGTNQGMRNSAVAITDTTYHIYAVSKAAGADPDYYAHTSADSATVLTALQAETGGADYAFVRRIASIMRVSGTIKPFYQHEDTFYWTDGNVTDLASGTQTTGTAVTLTVPAGRKMNAIITARIASPAGGGAIRVYDPDISAASAPEFIVAVSSASVTVGGMAFCKTNTSGEVKYWVTSGGTGTIFTHGYVDTRGRLG